MSYFQKNAAAADYTQRMERLLVPFSIVYHATPASKTYSTDCTGVLYLSMEGLTSVATALDSGTSFTTETDSTGIFGALMVNLGTVSKLLDVQIVNLSAGTATVSRKGASSTGVTASGNIAVSLDWSGNLATTSLTGTLVVDYIVSKN